MTFNVPEWFDLKLYKKTQKYTRRQWAADFQIRRDIYQRLLEIRDEVREYAEYTGCSVYGLWSSRQADLEILRIRIHAAAKITKPSTNSGR